MPVGLIGLADMKYLFVYETNLLKNSKLFHHANYRKHLSGNANKPNLHVITL
jgi:hypothetical protein